MRQAIHIFKKDVRGLWYQILLTLVVVAAFMFIEIRAAKLLEPAGPPAPVGPFLVFAWWILIARVIQFEPLPGDRQFWRTRPYAWKSLLGAKALFILVFVNVPILLADAAIVRAFGFSLFAVLPGLLWSQLLLTTIVILPMGAIAAVTTGLTQLLSTSFVIAAALFAFSIGVVGIAGPGAWEALDWIRSSVALLLAAIATAVVIFWQYQRRKTAASRLLIAGACVLIVLTYSLLPWTAAFKIQSHLSRERTDPSSIQVAADFSRQWLPRTVAVPGDRVQIDIPLQITNIPSGTDVIADGLSVSVEAPGQRIWRSDRKPWTEVDSEARIQSLRTTVDGSFYRRIRNQAVTIRGQMYLTLAARSKETSIPIESHAFFVPGAGICVASRQQRQTRAFMRSGQSGFSAFDVDRNLQSYTLLCHSAFRSPPNFLSASFEHAASDLFRDPVSYSPFPAAFSFSPVSQYFALTASPGRIATATLRVAEPIAFIRRQFEIRGIRLNELEIDR